MTINKIKQLLKEAIELITGHGDYTDYLDDDYSKGIHNIEKSIHLLSEIDKDFEEIRGAKERIDCIFKDLEKYY